MLDSEALPDTIGREEAKVAVERSRRLTALAATVLAMIAGAAWSRAHAQDPARSESPRILLTADTRGNLEPCGCEKGQFGGIARRATALAQLRRPGDLLLDLGDLGGGPGELHRLGWRVMVRALRDLKYDALVPGGSDLDALDELLAAASDPSAVPVVCANLVRSSDGRPVFAPWVVRSLSSGRRVALLGLTSESQPVPAGHRIIPLKQATNAGLAELAGKADVIVVAGWIEGQPALDLAKEFPDCALVLAGRVPRGSDELIRRAGVPVMAGGERGQYVVEVTLDGGGRPVGGRRHWLGEEVRPDATASALVDQWKMALQARGEGIAQSTLKALRDSGRVGSSACQPCHQVEYRAWAASRHAGAMETLRAKAEERNPLCMRCHLVDLPDNEDAGAGRGGVGCESCHGAGARHVADRRKGASETNLRTMGTVGHDMCVRCHDAENSRHFERAAFWSRIRHGGKEREEARK